MYLHFSGGFSEDGGGRFAFIGLVGAAVWIIGSGIERLTTRKSRK